MPTQGSPCKNLLLQFRVFPMRLEQRMLLRAREWLQEGRWQSRRVQ